MPVAKVASEDPSEFFFFGFDSRAACSVSPEACEWPWSW